MVFRCDFSIVRMICVLQEQSEEGKASSSASHTNDENGKEARKKKQGMLLYEDKGKTSRAREEDPDSSTNEGHPLRFKGIRAVNGKVRGFKIKRKYGALLK